MSDEARPDDDGGGGPFDDDAGAPVVPIRQLDQKEKRRIRDRNRRARQKAEAGEATVVGGGTPETPPRIGKRPAKRTAATSSRGRESLAPTITGVYRGLGEALAAPGSPFAAPAMAMMFNAPVVGHAADEALAGTKLDKRLQPMAKRGDKLRALKDAAGLPFIVFLASTRPELRMALRPLGISMLRANVRLLGPELIRQQQLAEEDAAAIADLIEAGLIDEPAPGKPMPSVGDLWDSLFAGEVINAASVPVPPE